MVKIASSAVSLFTKVTLNALDSIPDALKALKTLPLDEVLTNKVFLDYVEKSADGSVIKGLKAMFDANEVNEFAAKMTKGFTDSLGDNGRYIKASNEFSCAHCILFPQGLLSK